MQVFHFEGAEKSESVSAMEDAHAEMGDDRSEHEVGRGKYFPGTIRWFDNSTQACYIVFDDGEGGWYQLWRSSEHVKVLGT